MSAEMVRELATLGISSAEAFVSVVLHREAATGTLRPTFTVMAEAMSDEQKEVIREHLRGIAQALRAVQSRG